MIPQRTVRRPATPATKAKPAPAPVDTLVPGSRFQRLLTPINPLDNLKNVRASQIWLTTVVTQQILKGTDVAASGAFTVQTAKGIAPKVYGTGFKPNGHFYSMEMSFSVGDQGYADQLRGVLVGGSVSIGKSVPKIDTVANVPGGSWSNPLANPSTNAIYLMKVKITQPSAEPLVSGFKLAFKLPKGWTWQDGFGSTYVLEAASNPVVLVREMLSPAKFTLGEQGQFACAVTDMIPGYEELGQPVGVGPFEKPGFGH